MEKKKARRVNNMEEARKESKAEEIKEKPAKEKKEEKVRDHTDIAKELTGLVKENYLMGFQLGLSIWEGNLKIINNQMEQWASVQERYATQLREFFEKFPTEAVNFWNGNPRFVNGQVDKMIALQKDYSRTVMNTSDRFMKEALGLMKNSIERTFSSFNDYMNLIKG